jgi:ferredoxin
MSQIAIIGAGPTGLSALLELLELGFEANQLTIFDPFTRKLGDNSVDRVERLGLAESFESGLIGGPLSKKSGPDLSSDVFRDSKFDHSSRANFWGASCLPIPNWLAAEDIPFDAIQNAYFKVASRWGVQAEEDALTNIYQLTGETVGALRRKSAAYIVSNEAKSGDILLGHSRLALPPAGLSPCIYCGRCLQGCPAGIPWSPNSELNRILLDHPNLNVARKAVSHLKLNGKVIELYSSDESILKFDRVLVAAGWRNTPKLIQDINGKPFDPRKNLKQSNVLMKAILVSEIESKDNFGDSFAFHDLVLSVPPVRGKTKAYTVQIYLPSPELAGRIFANIPSLVLPIVKSAIRGNSSVIDWVSRRIAIAMIFTEGSDWEFSKQEIVETENIVVPHIRQALKPIDGFVIPYFRELLSDGRSEHVGSWSDSGSLTFSIKDLLSTENLGRVIAIDTCLLPFMPPGPHTAIAASLARLIAGKLAA